LGSFVIIITADAIAFFSTSRLMEVSFLGNYTGNFFTGRHEGTQSWEFLFQHFPNARLTDEDDENENWQNDVEYVGDQGTFETGIRQESNNFGCPGNTHQQEETQDHFKSVIRSDTLIITIS
jgi:hypothetical protein